MNPKRLPSTKYLRECFVYEPETGKLFWKVRPATHFASLTGMKICNKRRAGTEAFTSISHPDGYRCGNIEKIGYKAHRVIWKMVLGKEPPQLIDHVDRDSSNNRWNNLRAASFAQNAINRVGGWGKSKIFGLREYPSGSWGALIHKDGYRIPLGIFKSKEAALRIRKRAEKNLYGEFAP